MKQFFILALLFISFWVVSCSDPQSGNEQSITVNPMTVQFTTVYIGNYEEQQVTIKNTGTVSLEINNLVIAYELMANSPVPTADEFTIVDLPEFPVKLAKGESKIVTLRYAPTVASKYDEIALNIYNSTPVDKVSVEIKVAELYPQISVNPSTVIFAGISVGSEIESDMVIKNIGTANLVIKKGDIILSAAPAVSLVPFENSAIVDNTNSEDIVLCPNGETLDGCSPNFSLKVKYIAERDDEQNGAIRIKSNSSDGEAIIPIVTSSSECVLSLFPQESVIDLGNRRIGVTSSKVLVLKNSGQANCDLTNIQLTENDSNTFALTDLPDFPRVLGPRERINFGVDFSPTEEISYSAKFEIVGSDPTWEDGKKEFSLIGMGRIANGPVAVCKIAETNSDYAEVEPAIDNEHLANNSIITLDGRGSYDTSNPEAGLTYQWSKVSGPEGSSTRPQTPTQAQSKYFVDVTGSHKLKLTVMNADGETDSCEVEAFGLSANSLHIELFWDVGSDVDLHLRTPNGDDNDWFSSNDCYFGNCTTGATGAGTPCQDQTTCTLLNAGTCTNGVCSGGDASPDGLEWGQPGREDNPRLDRDDIGGTGPENINLQAPWDSQGKFYTVAADYYSADGAPNGTNASIRVYCNGDMQYSGTQLLEDSKYWWYAANINWIGDGEDGTCEVTPINVVQSSNP